MKMQFKNHYTSSYISPWQTEPEGYQSYPIKHTKHHNWSLTYTVHSLTTPHHTTEEANTSTNTKPVTNTHLYDHTQPKQTRTNSYHSSQQNHNKHSQSNQK